MRHAAAALLSSLHPDVAEPDTCSVCGNINAAYLDGDFEGHKNRFAAYNEIGCPLDWPVLEEGKVEGEADG